MMSAKLRPAVINESYNTPNAQQEECTAHKQTKTITFSTNNILRGTCLSHLDHCVIYAGMDTETGQVFTVKDLFINDDIGEEQTNQYLMDLIQLRHCNLAGFKSFKCEKLTQKKWVYYILQEFVFGSTCFSVFLAKGIPVQMDMLRHIASSVLHALEYLKSNGILEVNLMASSIYINPEGDVKVTDFGIRKALANSSLDTLDDCDSVSGANIYNFGILLLSLLKGEPVNSDEVKLSNIFPPVLCEFLMGCITKKNQDQLTIGQLLSHPFLKNPNEQKVFEVEDIVPTLESFQRSRSRVENDFIILEPIGKGGFGEVHKVENKLDGRVYALKKIKLNPHDEKLNNKLIREVILLSQLHHENIVRYYNSWTDIEDILESDTETDFSEVDENEAADYCVYMESISSGLNYYCEGCDMITADEKSETNSDDSINIPGTVEYDNMPPMQLTPRKILYIQMEYCKSNTLKSVIDNGDLFNDVPRIWKFLREIVEGLVHIHEQGIIHRDLKPMNIFLNSHDHVKIGDFGLATTNVRYKKGSRNKHENELPITVSKAENGSSTSRVGTALYKAPELSSSHICNEKLDMYSLGIILFEMCYKRPDTESERIEVLTNLRSSKIIFPENFYWLKLDKQGRIIRKLLNHNPLERPTSKELLKSNCIPPILQEEQQQEMFKHVIDNPDLKLFKYLMEYCFRERQSTNELTSNFTYRNISKLDFLTQSITNIFRKHGGQNLAMTTMMPQNSCSNNCKYCIKLMTSSGSIVSIPCNSRIPFARYVALNRNVTWLRRYSLEKIPKNSKFSNYLPEVYECVFDIVTPINLRKLKNFLPDAEVLLIINEIQNSLQMHPTITLCLNINHSLIIDAIFIECGIVDELQYLNIITFVLTFVTGLHRKIVLSNYLSDDMSSKLIKLTEIAYPMNRSHFILQHFTKPEAKELAKKGLDELKCIVKAAENLGVTYDIVLKPGLLNRCELYSGMLIELACQTRKKKYTLITGGRYDTVIENYQSSGASFQKSRLLKFGVGISVNLESLCEVLEPENINRTSEIVICSFSSKAVVDEKAKILRELWSAGIRCSFIKASKMKHLKSVCKSSNVLYALIITQKNIEKGNVTIGEWKNRWTTFAAKPVSIQHVVTTVKRILWNHKKVSTLSITELPHVDAAIPIIFKTTRELSLASKLYWKVRISEQVDICQQRLCGNTIIVATDIETNIISDFAASVKFDSNYAVSLEEFAVRYPTQYNHLKMICQHVYEEKLKNGQVNVILYNLKESTFFIHLL